MALTETDRETIAVTDPATGEEIGSIPASGFGFGPELLDELTRKKVVHLEPAP